MSWDLMYLQRRTPVTHWWKHRLLSSNSNLLCYRAWIWCGLLTSGRGRRLLLAFNQAYLSLWHPSGTFLMRQVEEVFVRKTEWEEMAPKRGRAPSLSPGRRTVWHSVFAETRSPLPPPCQRSGPVGLFRLHYRCLCAAWLSLLSLQVNLELEFKLPTLAKAHGSERTNWGLIWCCHPAGLPQGWQVAMGQQRVLGPCWGETCFKKKKKVIELILNVLIIFIQDYSAKQSVLVLWWIVQLKSN